MAMINRNLVLPTPMSSANLSPVQATQAAKGVTEMDRQRQALAETKEAGAGTQGADTSFAAALRRRIEPASAKADSAQGDSTRNSSQGSDNTAVSTDPSLMLSGNGALSQLIWPWMPPVQNPALTTNGTDAGLTSNGLPTAAPALGSALAAAISASPSPQNAQAPTALPDAAAGASGTDQPGQSTALDTVFAATLGQATAKATAQEGMTADFAAQLTRQMAEAGQRKEQSIAGLPDGSQSLQAAQAALNPAQTTPQHALAEVPSLPVQAPVSSAHWGQEVGQKLVWMANNQEQKAELVLNPQHLGRIEVSISVSNDLTNTQFVCATPEARQALEQALPQLREMFAQAGLNLGQANVGHGDSSQRDNQGRPGNRSGNDSSVGAISSSGSAPLRQGLGLVDTFA